MQIEYYTQGIVEDHNSCATYTVVKETPHAIFFTEDNYKYTTLIFAALIMAITIIIVTLIERNKDITLKILNDLDKHYEYICVEEDKVVQENN